VALGALDAWLFPQVIQESSAALVVGRIRRSILLVLWAWVGVVVAGVGFQKLTEYEDFVRAAGESAPVAWAFDAVVVGALVALAAVLAGGYPYSLPPSEMPSTIDARTCCYCYVFHHSH
jgi:hypothetical protein